MLARTAMLGIVSLETARYYEKSTDVCVLPARVRCRRHVGVIWRKDKSFGLLEQAFMQALRAVKPARRT